MSKQSLVPQSFCNQRWFFLTFDETLYLYGYVDVDSYIRRTTGFK